MTQTMLKEDPLSRIQREILEVTEREREFKEGHFRMSRLMSEHALPTSAPPPPLLRAASAAQLPGAYSRRFTPQASRGMMQRFIASRGRVPPSPQSPQNFNGSTTFLNGSSPISPVLASPPSPPAVARTPEGRPVRKGFVPVEEKIQKELREMKDREHELRRMRKTRSPLELRLSDEESSDSEDEDWGLRSARSIPELCAALADERSPSPRSAGSDAPGALRPAKSLAELCELGPGQEFLAPSSTRLIAQWESIIQQKQEAGAA